MIENNSTGCQEKLDNFLQAVEAAQKLQDDIIRYGLEAAHFYVEDVDGDWLEKWSEDDDQETSIEYIINFLESSDRVAVKLRKQFKDKSLTEIAAGLESCLSFSQKADRIFAIKDFLLYNFKTGEMNSANSYGYDTINLVSLAEELLEKLLDILDEF